MAGDLIGLPYPPPALAPTSRGPAILRGLNYASGAAGILNETGADYVSLTVSPNFITSAENLYFQYPNALDAQLWFSKDDWYIKHTL